MQEIDAVMAHAGRGLEGDRYCDNRGSWNQKRPGRRQVTLMNLRFTFMLRLLGVDIRPSDTRRNIFTSGVELMWLIGHEFTIGAARMRGVKYCDPCERPGKLSGKPGFEELFQDCGGLVAEIVEGGFVRVGDVIIPPPKGR